MSNVNDDDELAFKILNELEYSEERESFNLAKLFDSLMRTYAKGTKKPSFEIKVDLSYNGLRLGEKFEEGDFKRMFHDFKHNRKLHAKYAIKIFDRAISLLKELRNIQEITLQENEQCIIVGDLHGHFEDLIAILIRFNIPGKLYYFVFNGDWVDRGEEQMEVLLTIFYSFILYPSRVILNRGNHEDNQQNTQRMYHPCLEQITESYFGKEYGYLVYQKLDDLFRYIPLACIVNNPAQKQRLFVVHGGINSELDLDVINTKVDRTQFSTVCKIPVDRKFSKKSDYNFLTDVQDMLWSDPYPSDDDSLLGERYNELRNIGKQFGKDITKKFLTKHNLTMIVRSHECKAQGYKIMHEDRLITIFSASNYNQENDGCILKVSPKKPKLELLTYRTKIHSRKLSSLLDTDKLNKAIRKLRTRLYKLRRSLIEDFKNLDPNGTGIVTIDELIDVLNKHIPNIPFKDIKDRICECDDNENVANYESLFASVSVKLMKKSNEHDDDVLIPECICQNYETLQNIFNKIDIDRNGYITRDEFKRASKRVFKHLGIKFTEKEIDKFLIAMDKNNDGLIDLQEFNTAFTITLQDF